MPTRNELFSQIRIAVFLPPLSVYQQLRSYKHIEFWICVILTLLGYFPGLIYAMYKIVVVDSSHGDEEVYYRTIPVPRLSA